MKKTQNPQKLSKTLEKSSKTSKTLKRPQKYLFIKDQQERNTANTANIRLDNILNQ